MLARCARCHATFTTDHFGVQRCPTCGAELLLADPNAPPPAPAGGPTSPEAAPQPPAPVPAPAPAAPPPPAAAAQGGWGGDLPPPPGPPPGGYGGPPPPVPPGGWGLPPPGAAPEGPQLSAPFAERARLGFLSAFFETWKLVATQPQQFFRRVRVDRTWSAVLFGVVAYTVGAVTSQLYDLLAGAQIVGMMGRFLENVPPEQRQALESYLQNMGGGFAVVRMVLTPVFGFIGIFVFAAVFHAILLLLRATPRGFDATLTTVGYAAGLSLLLAVPACGGLIWMVWSLVVVIVGLGEAQRCGPGKAAAAVFAPVLLVCLCSCAVAAIGLGGLLDLGQGTPGGGVNL
jgi:hypothetical protein